MPRSRHRPPVPARSCATRCRCLRSAAPSACSGARSTPARTRPCSTNSHRRSEPMSTTIARPYARAAFAVARDDGKAAAWSQALAFAARVAADPEVEALLSHPALASQDAVALLAPEGAADKFEGFLAQLADNGRLAVLPEIAGMFEQLRADDEQVVLATITSATELPQAEVEQLREALKRRFGREVQVETAIDESLIGGAVIAAGDVVIDGSLRGKLGRLQSALAH